MGVTKKDMMNKLRMIEYDFLIDLMGEKKICSRTLLVGEVCRVDPNLIGIKLSWIEERINNRSVFLS